MDTIIPNRENFQHLQLLGSRGKPLQLVVVGNECFQGDEVFDVIERAELVVGDVECPDGEHVVRVVQA